ncbi:hypothetical protein PF010_g32309 [Phytophthora fragariae]|uniref:Uncharacterized protein n=1 Tax=Phytophthora fragariae TaxID=53985 RepID=A0A6G0JF15_9STRA|nr:hypothetical protein PF010_g32309 [Phytophthora fragariae]
MVALLVVADAAKGEMVDTDKWWWAPPTTTVPGKLPPTGSYRPVGGNSQWAVTPSGR